MRPDLMFLVRADEFVNSRELHTCHRLTSSGKLARVDGRRPSHEAWPSEFWMSNTPTVNKSAHRTSWSFSCTHMRSSLFSRTRVSTIVFSCRFMVTASCHDWVTLPAWTGVSVASLDDYIVPLDWAGTSHLYGRVVERVRDLHQPDGVATPRTIESVDVNIQPNCGRCSLPGGLQTLTGNGLSQCWRLGCTLASLYVALHRTATTRAWGFTPSSRLYATSPQLPPSATPEPLDAERPLVMLKAHALLAGESLPSSPEHTGGERHQTVALPQYTNIELVFDVETDPTHNVVFAAALDLMFTGVESLSWAPYHNICVLFWMEVFEGGMHKESIDWDHLCSALDGRAVDLELDIDSEDVDRRHRAIKRMGKAFFDALNSFSQRSAVDR